MHALDNDMLRSSIVKPVRKDPREKATISRRKVEHVDQLLVVEQSRRSREPGVDATDDHSDGSRLF